MDSLQKLLRPRPRVPRWIWALSTAAIAGSAYMLHGTYLAVESAESLRRAARMASDRAPPPQQQPSKAELKERKEWELLAAERSFKWYPLFRAIEQSGAPDIDLFEMSPDRSSGRLVLRGDALSMDALSAYIGRLMEQKGLAGVHLTHQKLKQRDGLTVISFEIVAQFNARLNLPVQPAGR